jgi:signal transduction protein with GAF and PtsI domain
LFPLLIPQRTQEHVLADRSSLFLLDPVENRLWARNIETGEDVVIPRDKGIIGQACRTGAVQNISDARNDPHFHQHIDLRTGYHTQSIVAAPILDEDGLLLGAASFINREGGTAFARDEQSLIEAVSRLCALGLRWPVVKSERDALRDRSVCLREITALISTPGEEVSGLIRKVMGKTQEMMAVDRCSMFLLDPDSKELFSRTTDGQEIRFSQYSGIAGHCATTVRVYWTEPDGTRPSSLTCSN